MRLEPALTRKVIPRAQPTPWFSSVNSAYSAVNCFFQVEADRVPNMLIFESITPNRRYTPARSIRTAITSEASFSFRQVNLRPRDRGVETDRTGYRPVRSIHLWNVRGRSKVENVQESVTAKIQPESEVPDAGRPPQPLRLDPVRDRAGRLLRLRDDRGLQSGSRWGRR